MYHVMSVKQTLREDLAECAYQFSCKAADWSRSDMHAVPMQFEPLELHVIDALGQQEVPDYFQRPAKAITEDVSVMKGPHAQEWIAAVLEEIESFKRLGVYEEVPKGEATSPPLPARLVLVTKPKIHGGPARKKARIVICGNFQDVHPDEFTASKTPSYPALRMALSVASHMGWPVECWDVSTAFLYARLFGDRDTDLGGNEIYVRPPRILVETKVVEEGVVWKIKKALYGLRTSPIAWETERDNTLKSLQWVHEDVSYRLLPCQGSPCLWTVAPLRPCIRENGFINKDGAVILTKVNAPPTIDEKLGEGEGTVREKNDALSQCRKYIGEMMWLTSLFRPDIAACLGSLASMIVMRLERSQEPLSLAFGSICGLLKTMSCALCPPPLQLAR